MVYPTVSIITVNYDHPEVTCELLKSLQKISYPDIEVIVVDNASPHDDPMMIAREFPKVRLILSKTNLGFAGGNNLGILEAKGKYVLLLNNDTEVEPGFLEPLVEKMENDPVIGAASPKIKFFNSPDTIQFSGQTPINPYTIRSRGLGYGAKDTGQFDQDAETAFTHGAAMMVPMEVIRKVGLMAESYFLYYEELDWGKRIQDAGYKLWYVHNSTVLHKESISTGRLSPLKTYYMNRSRILYLRRNVTGVAFLIAVSYQVFLAVPKNALMYLLKGKTAHFTACCRAAGWHTMRLFSRELHQNPVL